MKTNKWILDPSHSEMVFKVKHLMISTVTGHFRNFNVEAYVEDDDFSKISTIRFTAEVDSIDTGDKNRDEHLKSAHFFDLEKHSQIKFVSTHFGISENVGILSGNLTIMEVTRPITLNVEFGGVALDNYGQTKAGFTIDGKISRKEFGMTWGPVTEAGSIVVGDEVKFHSEIQLMKQP